MKNIIILLKEIVNETKKFESEFIEASITEVYQRLKKAEERGKEVKIPPGIEDVLLGVFLKLIKNCGVCLENGFKYPLSKEEFDQKISYDDYTGLLEANCYSTLFKGMYKSVYEIEKMRRGMPNEGYFGLDLDFELYGWQNTHEELKRVKNNYSNMSINFSDPIIFKIKKPINNGHWNFGRIVTNISIISKN